MWRINEFVRDVCTAIVFFVVLIGMCIAGVANEIWRGIIGKDFRWWK